MKKRNSLTVILAVLALVVATVWYLVIYVGNEVVGATGYLFILFAILVFFVGLSMAQLLLSRKKNFYLSAPFLILLAYGVLAVAISLIFMTRPIERKTLLIVIEVLLLALVALSLFMILAAEHATPSTDYAAVEWNNPMREMINKLRALKDDPENKDYYQYLTRLYERSVFMDTSIKREGDEDLLRAVGELEVILISQDYALGEKEAAVDKASEGLEELLRQREYEIRESPWNRM